MWGEIRSKIRADPRWLFGAYCTLAERVNRRIHRQFYSQNGLSVMEEDWDFLMVLDACRYDLFEERCSLNGVLESWVSNASESRTFLDAQFGESTCHDTIYITANPHADVIPENTFFKTRQLLSESWDKNLETVPPREVAIAIQQEHAAHPNKRIIAHFMQPHYPFIGREGRKLMQAGISPSSDQENNNDDVKNIWTALQLNANPDLTEGAILAGYRENLDLVLEIIKEEVLPSLSGKLVISADHGNLLGEWIGPIPAKVWGHPPYIRAKGLNRVPWFIIENGDRPNIEAEAPTQLEKLDQGSKDQLEAMGYV